MIIYGTKQCPDTAACLAAFDAKGRDYDFRSIENLPVLKEFLQYRDKEPMYEAVRAEGRVGIPLLVRDDGTLTFDWEALL